MGIPYILIMASGLIVRGLFGSNQLFREKVLRNTDE